MFDFTVDDLEVKALKIKIASIPAYLNKPEQIKALKKAAVPMKMELNHTTPFMYGTLLKDLAIRKSKFQDINEHSVIVGYRGGFGHVGYIGRFLEHGTKHIKERLMLRKAESNNLGKAKVIYEAEMRKIADRHLK